MEHMTKATNEALEKRHIAMRYLAIENPRNQRPSPAASLGLEMGMVFIVVGE